MQLTANGQFFSHFAEIVTHLGLHHFSSHNAYLQRKLQILRAEKNQIIFIFGNTNIEISVSQIEGVMTMCSMWCSVMERINVRILSMSSILW